MKYSNNYVIRGFSLVEILVALFIGLLLILGALQIYLNSFRSDDTNKTMAQMQSNAVLLSNLIARYARRAGYQGCVASDNITNFVNAAGEQMEYPKDAIIEVEENGNKSFKFSYAVIDVAGDLDPDGIYPYKDCDGNKLGEYSVTFLNDASKKSIFIKTSEFNRYEELVKNAQIVSVKYITFSKRRNGAICDNYQDNNDNTGVADCTFYEDKLSSDSDMMELEIEVFDPKKQVASYRYTSSIALRNRPNNLVHINWSKTIKQ